MHGTKKLTKLTEEQRDFAEKNHGLVFSFLYRKRLPADDFYDVIIFAYLDAVQSYHERPDLRKYSFSSYAFLKMRAALGYYFMLQSLPKRNAVIFSLDAMRDGCPGLYEQLAATSAREVYEDVEAREEWEAVKPFASPKDLEVLELRAQGYTLQEIGDRYNVQRNCHIQACARPARADYGALYGVITGNSLLLPDRHSFSAILRQG